MSPLPLAQPIVDYRATCVEHRALGQGLWRLDLTVDRDDPHPLGQPGQFLMLSVPGETFHFRRPFSLADFDPRTRVATIYYKVLGEGTRKLTSLRPGQSLQALAPLGQPFLPIEDSARTLLVAGGVGLPPLLWWGIEQHRQHQPSATLIYGVRQASELTDFLPWLDHWLGPEAYTVATNDGSYGVQGTVIDALNQVKERVIEQIDDVLLCGPNPMMAAVVAWFRQYHPAANVQVSLENHMPCGTGACYGCVVGPVSGNDQPIRVCLEGPVFPAEQLAWTDRGPLTGPWLQQDCHSPAEGGCSHG